jgi:hypothetical protein
MRSKQRTVNETLYKPLIPLLNFAGYVPLSPFRPDLHLLGGIST